MVQFGNLIVGLPILVQTVLHLVQYRVLGHQVHVQVVAGRTVVVDRTRVSRQTRSRAQLGRLHLLGG